MTPIPTLRLAEKLDRRGQSGERARERRETDEALAECLVQAGRKEAGWAPVELKRRAKGDAVKVALGRSFACANTDDRLWIAKRLDMESASYVSALLKSINSKL